MFPGTIPMDSSPVSGSTQPVTSDGILNSLSKLINALSTGTSTPVDADYFISQYVGGGTSNTDYYRRPISTLWNYLKSKLSNFYISASSFGTMKSYIKFANGILIQWGYIAKGSNLNHNSGWDPSAVSIQSYGNTNYILLGAVTMDTRISGEELSFVKAASSFQAHLWCRNVDDNMVLPVINWFTIGKVS